MVGGIVFYKHIFKFYMYRGNDVLLMNILDTGLK